MDVTYLECFFLLFLFIIFRYFNALLQEKLGIYNIIENKFRKYVYYMAMTGSIFHQLEMKNYALYCLSKLLYFIDNPSSSFINFRMNFNQLLGEVCNSRGVFIIDDLVYRDVTFDKANLAKPLATIPGMFRNTISLFGLSKAYGLAAIRAGFVVADELIIREIINRIFQ